MRCAWGSQNDYCFTTTALTSKIWLIYEDDAGEWQAKAVADIGDASEDSVTGRHLDQCR